MVSVGRPRALSRPAALGVWANGEHVGTWTIESNLHRFQYDPAWRQSPHARPLSLSLPFLPDNVPHRGDLVRNFFDNLLPDNHKIRERLRDKFSTGSTEAFNLLAAIGRDCVGAVQLLPLDTGPEGFDRVTATPLDDKGVEQAINKALSGGRALGQEDEDDFRISIAGAQEKTAMLWYQGRWHQPHGATPTTHIFKLPLGLRRERMALRANPRALGAACCPVRTRHLWGPSRPRRRKIRSSVANA
jgi:serine/threonine-protein kinase HipA